jgi:hypothetical protein
MTAITPDTVDARYIACWALALYVDTSGGQPRYYDGERMVPIEHYTEEIERRGEAHVFSCAGIYPTSYDPDGTARYDGPVCTYGGVEVVAAETTHIRYVGHDYDVKLPYPVDPALRPAD